MWLLLCLHVSGWMGCVTPSQYPRMPAGSLGTRRSSSLFALPGEWQGVTLWWGGRSGGEAIDPRPIVEMAQYPHLLQWQGGTHTKMCTHAHSRESYRDGQFCHQWLPSCHSDMERLGPYERFCSPKRCLGAGVRETCQSLLMRGHNQMWKLSCTLTGSIVAKSAARCNIDAVFQRVALRGWRKIGNTLATPDSFELIRRGSEC